MWRNERLSKRLVSAGFANECATSISSTHSWISQQPQRDLLKSHLRGNYYTNTNLPCYYSSSLEFRCLNNYFIPCTTTSLLVFFLTGWKSLFCRNFLKSEVSRQALTQVYTQIVEPITYLDDADHWQFAHEPDHRKKGKKKQIYRLKKRGREFECSFLKFSELEAAFIYFEWYFFWWCKQHQFFKWIRKCDFLGTLLLFVDSIFASFQ